MHILVRLIVDKHIFETIQSGFIKSLTKVIILQVKFNNLTIHFSFFKETFNLR
jgi:hypothetical protein